MIEKKCQESLDRGFQIIKLHEIKDDCIEAARSFVGKDLKLMTDVNCAWNYNDIVKERFLEKINLFWVEEPIFPPENYEELSKLRNNCNIKIAAGEKTLALFGILKK